MSQGANGVPTLIDVGVIGGNDETIAELVHYLSQVGTHARRIAKLRTLCESDDAREVLHALVIFPDDLEEDDLETTLGNLSLSAPALLQVIVTREPLRFTPPPGSPRLRLNRCVIPRPAFCWYILDTIRDYMERES
jgi:hypothetical protein